MFAGVSVNRLRNRFRPRRYAVQVVPSANSFSPVGLVAVFGASSNQTMLFAVVMVSGPFVTADADGTGKNTIPPRGTRLTSHGAARCPLVALIVYAILIPVSYT